MNNDMLLTKGRLIAMLTADFVKTVGFPILVAFALLWIGRDQMRQSMAREEALTDFVTTRLIESLELSQSLITNNGALITSNSKVLIESLATLHDVATTNRDLLRQILEEERKFHAQHSAPKDEAEAQQ